MISLHTYWIAFYTIAYKESQRFFRIWVQTIVPSIITTVLYFIIFGNLIGSRLGNMEGIPYIQFIVPGLIMMAIISNAFANVVSSFYGAKFARHVEELLIAPVPNVIILLGYVTGGILRGLTVGIAVTITALFFTNIHIHHPFIMIVVALLTAAVFSLGGFINAVFATKFDDVSLVPTFFLTPLTYLGGVFYSIKMLPEFWQTVSLANPILYMINAFRYSMFGVSDINVVLAIGLLFLFMVVLFIIALQLLNKGIGIRT
jgi:ABC-2 type transport system permease protein